MNLLALNKLVFALLILFALFTSKSMFAQGRVGIGIDGIYNFQSGGIGIGIKGDMNINKRLILASNFDYYPPFNTYHELYVGVEAMVPLVPIKQSWIVYPLAVTYYQMLFNHASFSAEKSKFGNFAYEAGIGLARAIGSYKPLLEGRYDFTWKEFNVRMGVTWYFGEQDKVKKRYQYLWKI